MADSKKAVEDEVEMAPDPDEDDLDDLDDVLDAFQPAPAHAPPSSSKPTAPPPSTAPTASGPGRPPAPADAPSEEALEAQLAAGMSNLISELDSDPDMQKRFEQMMQELMSGGVPGMSEGIDPTPALSAPAAKDVKAPESTSKKAAPASGPAGFEDTIKRTMDRINATDASATAAATSAEPSEEDLLAQMMKELGAGGGMDGEGEQDFNKMLMTMMTQLTNKEILYEPMKELHDKFPGWMETNKGKTEKSEMQRYKEQQRLVGEIVGRFERKGYSDENEDDREFIVERMQKMQAAGSPPPDLVGDMSSAQEAVGGMEEQCPTQ